MTNMWHAEVLFFDVSQAAIYILQISLIYVTIMNLYSRKYSPNEMTKIFFSNEIVAMPPTRLKIFWLSDLCVVWRWIFYIIGKPLKYFAWWWLNWKNFPRSVKLGALWRVWLMILRRISQLKKINCSENIFEEFFIAK